MSGDGGRRDKGLAPERTSLAWDRSSLSLLACGAAVLKGVPNLPHPSGRPIVGGVILALAAAAALVGVRAQRGRVPHGGGVIDRRVVRQVAFANAVIGLAALMLATLA